MTKINYQSSPKQKLEKRAQEKIKMEARLRIVLLLHVLIKKMTISAIRLQGQRKRHQMWIWFQLYLFALLMGGFLLWDYLSPLDLMGNYPHLVVLGIGLSFGFLVVISPSCYEVWPHD